jgi:hypothetical protein
MIAINNAGHDWYETVHYPSQPLLDPRFRPAHHSLLLALHRLTASDRSGEREWHEYGDERHAVAFSEAQVLHHARLGVQALPRYRRDLQQWGVLRYRVRPGYPSLYDIVAFENVFEPGLFFPIPVMVCDDQGLRPGHLAAYLALAYAAEQRRLEQLPENAGDLETWELPMYGSRCVLRGRQLDGMAGFRHSATRNRYVRELVHLGHAQIAHKAQKHLPSTYRLLSNDAADRALRVHLKEQDERWWQQYQAGELPHQQADTT